MSLEEAIVEVGAEGLSDVVPRFQTIGTDANIVAERFYEFDFGNTLTIKDPVFSLASERTPELVEELDARWSLLEGAFLIRHGPLGGVELANDVRDAYLLAGHRRTDLTRTVPFLQAYQGNVCFYCSEPIPHGDAHVDHVLPRSVLQHDEVWNLVLCHSTCNLLKSDRLVADHFMVKLIARNENIMGSNHPWRQKISTLLGGNRETRASKLRKEYERTRTALGHDYWGGSNGYSPANDPFYRRLITRLNNRGEQ